MTTVVAWLVARPRLALISAAAFAVLLLLAAVYVAGRHDGARSVIERYERQDRRAEDAAGKGWRAVRACAAMGGKWDVATGSCD